MSLALKHRLLLRAKVLAAIRAFFAARDVQEVDTPLLASTSITDPYLNPLWLTCQQKILYLQTSPEYAMKRLLSGGSGSIYQLCKAFRDDEHGKLHRREFTMLEWYRVGFNHHDLMDEMDDFLQAVIQAKPAVRYSYQEIFEKYMNINPHDILLDYLIKIFNKNIILNNPDVLLDKSDYLSLLLDYIFEKENKRELDGVIFIYDFPAEQAALAKIRDEKGCKIGERFEVYINGIELANGYHELADAHEQRKRFEKDLEKREKLGYKILPIDGKLLQALEFDFPDCAGVALGVDRLLMIMDQQTDIKDVMTGE